MDVDYVLELFAGIASAFTSLKFSFSFSTIGAVQLVSSGSWSSNNKDAIVNSKESNLDIVVYKNTKIKQI